jgi:hypothetical protein
MARPKHTINLAADDIVVNDCFLAAFLLHDPDKCAIGLPNIGRAFCEWAEALSTLH